MSKTMKSIITLSTICLIIAVALAGVNYITEPFIKAAEDDATNAALRDVYPSASGFERVDISEYEGIAEAINEIYRADDGGFVVKLTTTGYSSGMVIMCGIDTEGVVTGAVCIASSETLGYEKTYGVSLISKDLSAVSEADTVSGATKTTKAYRDAVALAIETAEQIKGGD